MTGFCMKCNTGQKCVNALSIAQLRLKSGFCAPKVNTEYIFEK